MSSTAGTSLHGDNVCTYRITDKGAQEISNGGIFTVLRDGIEKNGVNFTDDKALIIKKCCPGYISNDGEICIENRVANPFSESQFSYAMIYLGILLFVVALLSMFIAYRYHYRFQKSKKHGLINNNYDDHVISNSLECQPIQHHSMRQNDTSLLSNSDLNLR